MAKFCTKCGKKLEEGQVCDCGKKSKVEVKNSNTAIDLKESSMDCLNVFKKIFTKPFDAIKEFVCENKFIAGIIMIVVAALVNGLYRIATLKSLYSSISYVEPEYLKEFFTTFATNLAEYALLVVIGYLIVSKLLKGTTTWKYMVNAVAISASIVLVGNVVNSVLVFIDGDFIGNIMSYVTTFASILSILLLYGSVKEIKQINKDKLFISIASMSILVSFVIDVIEKLFN